MADHPVRTIMTNLRTQLATITTGNGYKSDIGDIARMPEVASRVPQGATYPWCGVTALDDDSTYFPSNMVRTDQRIVLSIFHRGADRDGVESDQTDLLDDIRVALGTDITLSGACAWLRINGVRRGYTSDTKMGFMHVELETRYYTLANVAS